MAMTEGGDECTCGLLPCVCVTEEEALRGKNISELRNILQPTSSICECCLMLPCLCDSDPYDDNHDDDAKEDASIHAAEDENIVHHPIDAFGRVPLSLMDDSPSQVWVASEVQQVLKPHQVEGVQFLLDHINHDRGCILADYMGLGKTLQLITSIHSYITDGLALYVVVRTLLLHIIRTCSASFHIFFS
jgi:SNF2 family DNA or RNA helicase